MLQELEGSQITGRLAREVHLIAHELTSLCILIAIDPIEEFVFLALFEVARVSKRTAACCFCLHPLTDTPGSRRVCWFAKLVSPGARVVLSFRGPCQEAIVLC